MHSIHYDLLQYTLRIILMFTFFTTVLSIILKFTFFMHVFVIYVATVSC